MLLISDIKQLTPGLLESSIIIFHYYLIVIKLPYLAKDFDGRRHFLLADFFVFLLFRGGFEALPRQRGLVEIHENVTQTLHVIPEEKVTEIRYRTISRQRIDQHLATNNTNSNTNNTDNNTNNTTKNNNNTNDNSQHYQQNQQQH